MAAALIRKRYGRSRICTAVFGNVRTRQKHWSTPRYLEQAWVRNCSGNLYLTGPSYRAALQDEAARRCAATDPSEAADVLVSVTSTLEVCFSPFVGGIGRFAGATGDLTNIGEADLQAGTALR